MIKPCPRKSVTTNSSRRALLVDAFATNALDVVPSTKKMFRDCYSPDCGLNVLAPGEASLA